MSPCTSSSFVRMWLDRQPKRPWMLFIERSKAPSRTRPTPDEAAVDCLGRGCWDYSLCVIPRETSMSIGTILLIVLVLLLIGALPTWRYSGSWGYFPSGGLGLVLIVLLVLMVSGRL